MDIRTYLRSCQVRFEAVLHRPVPTAAKRAHSMHTSGHQVAKGVLLRRGDDYLLAVLPATRRIDLAQLGVLLRTTDLRIATEDELERVFVDCQRGALPPFGRLYGLTTVVDASLAESPEIVLPGNTQHEGVRMRYRDFEALETPVTGRFSIPIAPRLREPRRRAG